MVIRVIYMPAFDKFKEYIWLVVIYANTTALSIPERSRTGVVMLLEIGE
jgi:hypothetical protein